MTLRKLQRNGERILSSKHVDYCGNVILRIKTVETNVENS